MDYMSIDDIGLWREYGYAGTGLTTTTTTAYQPSILLPNGDTVVQNTPLTFHLSGFRPNTKTFWGFEGRGQGDVITNSIGEADVMFTVSDPPGTYSFYAMQPATSSFVALKVSLLVTVVANASPVTWVHYLEIGFWNPFGRNLQSLADALSSTVRTLLLPLGQFKVVSPIISTSSIKVVVEERGSPALPLLAWGGIFLAVLVGFQVILTFFNLVSQQLATNQIVEITKQKQTDAQIIDQITSVPGLTPEQKTSLVEQLYPSGLPENPRESTSGTDSILATVTTIIPVVVGISLLGVIVSILPKKGD